MVVLITQRKASPEEKKIRNKFIGNYAVDLNYMTKEKKEKKIIQSYCDGHFVSKSHLFFSGFAFAICNR